MNIIRIYFLCVCVWMCSIGAAWSKPRKGLRKYTVQRGESCWSIALKLYGKGQKYRVIHKYNRLGAEPHILKPGQILYLPGSARRADANIEWLRKSVRARPPRTLDWLRAREKMSLWRLYKVKTGTRASAGIRFDDTSYMKMREQALLVIFGSSAQRVQRRRLVRRTIVVERGVIKGGLGSLDGKTDLTVKTPSSEIKLTSKLAQIEVDKAKTSSLSVYDGNATMKAKGKKVKVPRNYGTYAKKGKKPAKPVPLPSAPLWEGGRHEAVVFVPQGQFGRLTFRWKPVRRAHQYRFEISSRADFRIILNDEQYPPRKRKALPGKQEVEALVGKGVLGFRHVRLQPGMYYARVAARDRNRLEGYPSKTLRIKVLPLFTSRRLQPSIGGVFEAVGLLGIRPPTDKQVDVSVDKQPFTPFVKSIRFFRPGLHTLRFRPKRKNAVQTMMKVRLLPVDVKMIGPTKPIRHGSGKHPIKLSLRATFHVAVPSAQGTFRKVVRGVILPGLQLKAYPGGILPLQHVSPGVSTAQFVAPAIHPGADVVVVLRWAGGELARQTIAMLKPPARVIRRAPPPKRVAAPPIFNWPTAAVAMEWANSGPAMPSRAARPTSSLQLSSFLQQRTFTAGTNTYEQLLLRISFLGQLSLLKERLGIDLELPWLQLNLLGDSADRNKLGDLRVGMRFVAFRTKNLLLTPSLRVSLPTGGDSIPASLPRQFVPLDGVWRTRRNIVFEPGLLLAWRVTSWLTFHTNQMLVLETDFIVDPGVYYTSIYGLELRPWRMLSFALELNLVLGTAAAEGLDPGLQGLGVSGALRLHFDRARIGLVGGGNFTPSGQIGLGGFSVGLTFAFGFPSL